MIYDADVNSWQVGDEVEGFYLLTDAVSKTSAAGKPYLAANVTDGSGAMALKAWDYAGPVDGTASGAVVKLRGRVQEYRGDRQLVVDKIRLATDGDSYDLGRIVPTAPIDVAATWQYVCQVVDSLHDEECRALASRILALHEDTLTCIPAAKSIHHGFVGGLLMHTANMLRIADQLSVMYGHVVSRDLLLTGVLCHDIAKDTEFAFSAAGLVNDYTVAGRLLGHSVLEAREIAELCAELGVSEEKSLLLQHMVLAHHGEPEFGAAVIPQCAEAELLHLIDLIDSKMEIYAEALSDLAPGAFSNRIYALDKRIYHPDLD